MLHISPDEQKERLLARLDDPTKHWKYNPGDVDERRAVAGLPRGLRDRAGADQHRARAVVRDPERQEVVPQPRRSAGCCTRPCAGMDPQWPAADFDVDGGAPAAGRRGARLVIADRLASPATSPRCARAAACPGSSRPTTWAPTSASSAAPARGCGCWSPRWSSASWPARIGLRTPRLVALDLDPEIARYEADEEVQDLLNASAGLNLGVDFLPGAFGFDGDAAPEAPEDGRPGCCGWTRSARTSTALAQPQPAALARRPLGDRPRRRAVLPPRLGAAASATPRGSRRSPGTPPTTCCGALRRRAAGASTPRSRGAARRARSSPRCSAQVPDEWLEPVPGAETPDAVRAAYVAFLTARLGTRQWLPAGGAGMSDARWPTSTSCCAACPRVDREEFLNVGVVLYCQAADFLAAAWHVDRERLLAVDPGVDLDQVCARAGLRRRRLRRRRDAGERRPRSRSASGSASCRRPEVAPCSSPARCTAASPRTPPPSSTACCTRSSTRPSRRRCGSRRQTRSSRARGSRR